MISTTDDFSSILDNREELFYIMNDRTWDPEKKLLYYIVNLEDFSFFIVKLNSEELSEYNNNLDYLIYTDDEESLIELCKMKLYYWGLKLDKELEDIIKITNSWISWIKYSPFSMYLAWLTLDPSAIYT